MSAPTVKRVLVRYRVRPECVAENERQVAAVFAQLDDARPAGLRYASLRLDDGVSFVHIVSLETADGEDPLRALPAFQAFVASVRGRCAAPPVATPFVEIGAYRLLDG
jgi:hypothetical protein